MSLLSCIGILFVVLGHINPIPHNCAIGTLYGWFPYYSFHMPLFLFITGYFYKETSECAIFSLIRKKTKTLLIPYFSINGFFLVFQTILRKYGFEIGRTFSLKKWLVFPWITLQPLTFSIPTWYLIALFIAEIYFVLIRKIYKKIIKSDFIKEMFLLGTFFFLGMVIVYIIKRCDHSNEVIRVYSRSFLMLFFIELGVIYKKYIEKKDCLDNYIYFGIVFFIQACVIAISNNSSLGPGLYGIEGFEKCGLYYYITGVTGIALWLRITKIIATHFEENKILIYIGKNTKSIMAFYLLGFWLFNLILEWLYKYHHLKNFIEKFDPVSFHSQIYYTYTEEPRLIVFYVIFGVGISLAINYICL